MTERCPLCDEDIQVSTVGPQGLAQHKGKKKCLATVKKKQEDAVMVKEPTLFSYLRRQDAALPIANDRASKLAKDAERKRVEDDVCVVVSQVMVTKAATRTYTSQHADQDAQGQSEETDPSIDRDLDLDLNQDLDQGQDQDKPLTWLSVRVRGYEPGLGPPTRSATPNKVQNDVETLARSTHEVEQARNLVQSHKGKPQASWARNDCRGAWLLLDCLRAEIRIIHGALEDNDGNELSLAGYNRSAVLSVCADIPQNEVWENVNPGLDRILGFGRSKGEIAAMVHGGREGLQGLYNYLEVLVERGGIVGGLLEGKVTALMTAMAEYVILDAGTMVNLTLCRTQATPPVCSYAGSSPSHFAYSRDTRTSYRSSGVRR